MDRIIFRQIYAIVLTASALPVYKGQIFCPDIRSFRFKGKRLKKVRTKNAHDTLNIITFYYKFGNMLFLTNPQRISAHFHKKITLSYMSY